MKAAVLYGPHQPLEVADLEVLPPREGEVLVRMAAGGVCHSDLHVMQGHVPAPFPCVPGHEGAGIVVEVGPGVQNVRPGDHVVLLWRASCGACYFCSRGRPALCDLGGTIRWTGKLADGTSRFRKDGQEINHFAGVSAFAEYTVVPAAGVIAIPPEIPLEKAAVVGCAVMTGVGAVINTAAVEPGASVAVFGCGGVGLNVVQGAALAGAERIIAVDIRANKLDFARQFGATHTVLATETDPVVAIRDLTGGRGADYAFEVIGRPETLRQAYEATRRGGTTVAIGLPPTGTAYAVDAQSLVLQEKTLKGSLYGGCVPARDVPRLLALYQAGRLNLEALITRAYPLDQINEAFAALERGEVARSIIRLA
jgi:NDMA-dependent alcohol dehydrogenase